MLDQGRVGDRVKNWLGGQGVIVEVFSASSYGIHWDNVRYNARRGGKGRSTQPYSVVGANLIERVAP